MTIIFLRKGKSICAKINILNLTKLTTCIWVLFYRLQSPLTIVFFVLFCSFVFFCFFFGCIGSSFLYEGFLQLWQAGATLHRGARASHHRGLSCCGAQAPDAQAQ